MRTTTTKVKQTSLPHLSTTSQQPKSSSETAMQPTPAILSRLTSRRQLQALTLPPQPLILPPQQTEGLLERSISFRLKHQQKLPNQKQVMEFVCTNKESLLPFPNRASKEVESCVNLDVSTIFGKLLGVLSFDLLSRCECPKPDVPCIRGILCPRIADLRAVYENKTKTLRLYSQTVGVFDLRRPTSIQI